MIPNDVFQGGWPPVWWVGCHGGAGASTLARLVGFGADFGRAWPLTAPMMPPAQVVLVCRLSAHGTWAATGAIEQWRRREGMPGTTSVLGVVAVAASPRRPPRIATERLHLLSGWAPQVWRVGWVDALLAADDPRDVGTPPDIETLRHALAQKIHTRPGETR
ncbi:hypothetical protein [Micromonospora citrea]|uniref:hypothetical protein n=1 Tax=Micromonospora citrea TaxID=47855 RepID=UPI000AD215FD|nr:hypothetical protein [Micromonospora citrea]